MVTARFELLAAATLHWQASIKAAFMLGLSARLRQAKIGLRLERLGLTLLCLIEAERHSAFEN
jgi:hypothetical protein